MQSERGKEEMGEGQLDRANSISGLGHALEALSGFDRAALAKIERAKLEQQVQVSGIQPQSGLEDLAIAVIAGHAALGRRSRVPVVPDAHVAALYTPAAVVDRRQDLFMDRLSKTIVRAVSKQPQRRMLREREVLAGREGAHSTT